MERTEFICFKKPTTKNNPLLANTPGLAENIKSTDMGKTKRVTPYPSNANLSIAANPPNVHSSDIQPSMYNQLHESSSNFYPSDANQPGTNSKAAAKPPKYYLATTNLLIAHHWNVNLASHQNQKHEADLSTTNPLEASRHARYPPNANQSVSNPPPAESWALSVMRNRLNVSSSMLFSPVAKRSIANQLGTNPKTTDLLEPNSFVTIPLSERLEASGSPDIDFRPRALVGRQSTCNLALLLNDLDKMEAIPAYRKEKLNFTLKKFDREQSRERFDVVTDILFNDEERKHLNVKDQSLVNNYIEQKLLRMSEKSFEEGDYALGFHYFVLLHFIHPDPMAHLASIAAYIENDTYTLAKRFLQIFVNMMDEL